MNLFENILTQAQPKEQFLSGFTPTQPQPKKMTLFSDETTMLGKMKADGLDDEKAMTLLKKRRSDLLQGNTKLDDQEKNMLLKMQADNLTAKQATAMIQKRRADQFEKKYQE